MRRELEAKGLMRSLLASERRSRACRLPALREPAGSEHGRKKYRNSQSISHLPLSSSSSCADKQPSKSPYGSKIFLIFSPPLLPSQRCLVRQGWLREPRQGCPLRPFAEKYPKAVQSPSPPTEHPSRLQRSLSSALRCGKAAGCRQELSAL